jgi:hypothetical protein
MAPDPESPPRGGTPLRWLFNKSRAVARKSHPVGAIVRAIGRGSTASPHAWSTFAATLFFREKAFASLPTQGRSSGFRFVLLAEPSRWRLLLIRVANQLVMKRLAVALSGFRPRLQRRDRDGIAPSSLFFPASNELPGHLVGWQNLAARRRRSRRR